MKHITHVTIPSASTPAPATLLETTQKGAIVGAFATALGTLATAFNTTTTGLNTLAHKSSPAKP